MNTDELFDALTQAYHALGQLASDREAGRISETNYHTDHAAIHRHKARIEEDLRKAKVNTDAIKAHEREWQRAWVQTV